MINSENLTCLIPTKNASKMLDIFLATIKYYIPNTPNIYIIDRDSVDNTKDIAKKYNCEYFNLPENPTRIWDKEHVDSIEYGVSLCNTEWILLLHNDMEFVNFDFWNEINQYPDADVIYSELLGEPIIRLSDGGMLYAAPKTCFLLLKKGFYEEAIENNISIDSRFGDNCFYDVFYDMWQWAENNNKVIKKINNAFYIHYWGYTNYRANPDFKKRQEIFLYCNIIDNLIDLKLKHLQNNILPFPERMQTLLKNTLNKDMHSQTIPKSER
jgi:hypothetical protein